MSQNIPDNEIYQQLRLAIDDAREDKILSIFNDYPDVDWNHITPNGLSALWWALTPPRGKPINHELVAFLLSLKRNAESVINPIQLYAGLRPFDYVSLYFTNDDENKKIRDEILTAETEYSRIWQTSEIIGTGYQINQDTHSASNPFIVRASDENLKRLYTRYKAQLNIDSEIKDIDTFLTSKKFTQAFPRHTQRQYICKALEEIKKDTTTRSNMPPEIGPSTLKEALALVWLAAKETGKNLVLDPDPVGRQKAVLKDLFEICKANSCWLGRWGRIGTTLSNLHEDVYYKKDSLITGELAKNKFAVLIGTAIADIHKTDKAKYYSIIRYRLGIGDEKDETVAKKWWQAGLTPLKTLMVEANIAPNEIEKLISDTNAETISLSHHEPTRQLNLLLCSFQRMKKENFFELASDKNIDQTLELLKTSFINNCLLLPNNISKLNLPVKIINQIKLRIINTLLDRKYEDAEIEIVDLWEVARTQIKIDELKNNNLSNWYKTLDLNKQIDIARDCQENDTLLTGEIVALAIKYSCITGLSFREMDLSGFDFRGWDLSGIDFSKANLTKTDLRLIDAEETVWKDCILTGANFNQFLLPEAFIGSNQCTEETLKKQDNNGSNLLHIAIRDEKIPLIKAILTSQHCSKEVLKQTGGLFSYTPLHCLAHKAEAKIYRQEYDAQEFSKLLELYINSPHCTEEVLSKQDSLSQESVLHFLIHAWEFPLAQIILNSKNCTEQILEIVNINKRNALHELITAYGSGIKIHAFVSKLLNSQKCTEKVFSTQDVYNDTPLQITVKRHSPFTKAIETAQTRCFLKNLKEFLAREDTTKEQILERFNELKDKNGKYAYIHVQLNPTWDRFRLFFKRTANGEKNFWHTEAYQAGVKMLKNAYLKKGGAVKDKAKEKAFIDYYRGNSPIHLLPTSTRRAFNNHK